MRGLGDFHTRCLCLRSHVMCFPASPETWRTTVAILTAVYALQIAGLCQKEGTYACDVCNCCIGRLHHRFSWV